MEHALPKAGSIPHCSWSVDVARLLCTYRQCRWMPRHASFSQGASELVMKYAGPVSCNRAPRRLQISVPLARTVTG